MQKLTYLTIERKPYGSNSNGTSNCAGGGSCQNCGGGHCGNCGGGKCS